MDKHAFELLQKQFLTLFLLHAHRILADYMLHDSLTVKLERLRIGPNTRQLCRAGVNKIKQIIRNVGWVPTKGIIYVIPEEEHADQCEGSFLNYDFLRCIAQVRF